MGVFVPKWVWLGITSVRERFESRSSLFSQDSAFYWPSDSSRLQYCDRLLAVLLSVFFSQMQAHSKWLWGFLCRNGCGLAYSRCGRGLRAAALSLAKIVPLYWSSDSSRTVIGYWLSCCPCFSVKCRLIVKGCGVFCAEMGVPWHILGAGEVCEPQLSL